jgi:hypothetical protein
MGLIFGCPDGDGDRIPDVDDRCPTHADLSAPDYFADGCPDAVYGIRYQLRATPRGLVLKSLRLTRLAGYSHVEHDYIFLCRLRSGKTCTASQIGGDKPFPPGARFVIGTVTTYGGVRQLIECHRLTFGRRTADAASYRGPERASRWGEDCSGLLR